MKTLLIIGGFFWIGLFVFHLMFWYLFDWRKELKQVSKINGSVMQVLNLSLMAAFLIFAYASLFHAEEMLTTPLGNVLLVGIAGFGVFRAIEQIVFFGLRSWQSVLFFGLVLGGTSLYLIPLVRS